MKDIIGKKSLPSWILHSDAVREKIMILNKLCNMLESNKFYEKNRISGTGNEKVTVILNRVVSREGCAVNVEQLSGGGGDEGKVLVRDDLICNMANCNGVNIPRTLS